MGNIFSNKRNRNNKNTYNNHNNNNNNQTTESKYSSGTDDSMIQTKSHIDPAKLQHQQIQSNNHLNELNFFSEYENVLYVNSGQNDTCLFGHNDDNYSLTLFDFNKKKEVKKWKGHEKDVTKVIYCQKLNLYLSASRDKSIKLWSLSQPTCKLDMSNGHTLVVNGLGINTENTFVISGSRDNNLNLWDLQTGKLLLTSHISRNLVTDLNWSVDGKLLIQSSEDKEIRLWDPMSLKLIFSFPKKQYIQASCHLSTDSNYAISSSNGFQGNGCEISLWDLRKRALVHEFLGHGQTVSCAKFIQSNKYIASSSHDSTVGLWDVNSLKQIENLYIGGTLTSISEMTNGALVTSSLTTGIHLIDKPV